MERSKPPLEDSISLKKYHMPSASRTTTPRPSRAATPGTSRAVTPGPSRGATPGPSRAVTPGPSRAVTPGPSRAVTPGPSRAVTPGPSRAVTPGPSRAVTPGPSRAVTPGPSRMATPRPSRAGTPRPSTPQMVSMVPVVQYMASWHSKATKVRGVIAIFLALIAIFLNIIWFIKPGNQFGSTVVSTGLGFWIGVVLLATGVLAVFTASRPSEGQICCLLILSIITLMADLAVFALACAQIAFAADRNLRKTMPVYAGGHMAFGIIFLALSVVIFAVVLSLCWLSRQVLQHATWQAPVVYLSPYGADMSSVKSIPYIITDSSRPVSRCPSMRLQKR